MEYWNNGKYEENSQFDQTNQYSSTPLLHSFFCAINSVAFFYDQMVNPVSLLSFLLQTLHQLQ